MASQDSKKFNKELMKNINKLHTAVLKNGLVSEDDIRKAYLQSINGNESPILNVNNNNNNSVQSLFNKTCFIYCVTIILSIFIATPLINNLLEYVLGIRCLVPNNYLIWEATRPVSDCSFCDGITRPIILENLTQQEFMVS